MARDVLKLSRLPDGGPEVFVSVQGEGVSLGRPSVFVRLALCNLACGFCDTAFTWDWSRFDPRREIVRVDVEALGARVLGTGVRNVVLTGGEPLLQQRALGPLVQRLTEAGRQVEIETNGTVLPEGLLAERVAQWNVSPKLANSGSVPEAREVAPALAWFALHPGASFKFVVADPADVLEVQALAARHGLPAERVLLMPEGTDAATLLARSAWLVDRCLESGFRFTTRLHILLWGDTRGT